MFTDVLGVSYGFFFYGMCGLYIYMYGGFSNGANVIHTKCSMARALKDDDGIAHQVPYRVRQRKLILFLRVL